MDVPLKRFDALSAWIARHEKALVGAILGLSVLRFLWQARRHFWFDELFTFYISRLGSLHQIVEAAPVDGNPPLYYLLAHFCLRLLGESELATRAPSILAFTIALLGGYLFVRRRCPAGAALLTLFALAIADANYFGAEARPYALVLAFTAITLVSWQAATSGSANRLLPLAGMAVGIAGAIASHHFGVLHVGIPLALGEAVRLVNRRRLDLPLYGAGVLGASMLALTVPLILKTNNTFLNDIRTSPVFYAKPKIADLDAYFMMTDPWAVGVFCLLLAGALCFLPTAPREARQPAIPAHEVAAAAGLAALVPIMIAITWVATGYFQPRYTIGASLGIAILLGFAAGYAGDRLRSGAAAALLGIALLGSFSVAYQARQLVAVLRDRHATGASHSGPSVLDSAPANLPIVVADPGAYLPLWWYAPPALRDRLHYLTDLSFAIKLGNPLLEISLVASQRFTPSKIEDYGAFVSTHNEFLLYCEIDGAVDCNVGHAIWINPRLLSEGYSLSVVSRGKRDVLLLAKR